MRNHAQARNPRFGGGDRHKALLVLSTTTRYASKAKVDRSHHPIDSQNIVYTGFLHTKNISTAHVCRITGMHPFVMVYNCRYILDKAQAFWSILLFSLQNPRRRDSLIAKSRHHWNQRLHHFLTLFSSGQGARSPTYIACPPYSSSKLWFHWGLSLQWRLLCTVDLFRIPKAAVVSSLVELLNTVPFLGGTILTKYFRIGLRWFPEYMHASLGSCSQLLLP